MEGGGSILCWKLFPHPNFRFLVQSQEWLKGINWFFYPSLSNMDAMGSKTHKGLQALSILLKFLDACMFMKDLEEWRTPVAYEHALWIGSRRLKSKVLCKDRIKFKDGFYVMVKHQCLWLNLRILDNFNTLNWLYGISTNLTICLLNLAQYI